jgi:hypothetical protein
MIPEETRLQMQLRLRTEVGGFFTNASRGPDTCAVCTGPAAAELCWQCQNHRSRYGEQLADQTILFAYAKAGHQSGHHMYRYKNRINPSEEVRRDLKLMILGGTYLHGECIARAFGRWEVITFVSSQGRPGVAHPVVELAQQVVGSLNATKILLDIGPDIAAEPRRFPLPSRFVVAEQWRPHVLDRHVLVVDDTWVSGDKGQSAALALKAVGARAVTVMCLARWLSARYSVEHEQLIKAAAAPYDALLCPVTGGACPPGPAQPPVPWPALDEQSSKE